MDVWCSFISNLGPRKIWSIQDESTKEEWREFITFRSFLSFQVPIDRPWRSRRLCIILFLFQNMRSFLDSWHSIIMHMIWREFDFFCCRHFQVPKTTQSKKVSYMKKSNRNFKSCLLIYLSSESHSLTEESELLAVSAGVCAFDWDILSDLES